ncbi:hypothetical protein [Streptomyces atroolivaceus]|uniref:hypothetical protein n=1 Tax=Streptomyces atroolivaceus TaxID=66869 RepID=UPI00378A62D1
MHGGYGHTALVVPSSCVNQHAVRHFTRGQACDRVVRQTDRAGSPHFPAARRLTSHKREPERRDPGRTVTV